MGRTLLIAHPKTTWRDWLKDNRISRQLLIVDPADADHGTPARLLLIEGDRTKAWQFVGTTEPQNNPIAVLSSTAKLLQITSQDALILTYPLRLTPVLRQLAHSIAQLVQPEQILVPNGSRLDKQGWIIDPQSVELPPSLPPLVQDAQRRSRWIELYESGEDHTVDLDHVTTEGSRLGGGTRLAHKDFAEYGEVAAGTLHIVTSRKVPESEIGRVMDIAHARQTNFVDPSAYSGLICSFAHRNGSDFGMGVIKSFDPVKRQFQIRCQAVAPAPIKVLKIGSTRITDAGIELEQPKPWSV